MSTTLATRESWKVICRGCNDVGQESGRWVHAGISPAAVAYVETVCPECPDTGLPDRPVLLAAAEAP